MRKFISSLKRFRLNIKTLQIYCFLLVVTLLMITTMLKTYKKIIPMVKNIGTENVAESFSDIQDTFKSGIFAKAELADIASLGDKALCRIFGDNYSYLRDENGYIHKIDDYQLFHILQLDMVDFRNRVRQRGNNIPFVYVQNPLRADLNSEYDLHAFTNTDNLADESYNILSEAGIDYLQINPEITTYFKTDMHADTISQIKAMAQIVDYLEGKYGINFQYKYLLDVENAELYDKEVYPMVGGYGRNMGAFFTDRDSFDRYIPKFDTSFTVDLIDSNVSATAPFNNMLIRVPEPFICWHSYWITEMAFYSHSLYRIVNNNIPDAPKLIMIMDSACLSGLPYLSMICSEILVFDPRFSDDIKFCNKVQAAIDDYDAVIVDTLNDCSDEFNIFVQFDLPSEVRTEHENPVTYEIQNFDDQPVDSDDTLVIDHNSEYVLLSGYAYDNVNQLGLGHIYLRIGDEIIKCNYGADTVGQFNNEFLDHVGFNVQIPIEMFKEASGQIELLCEGCDNTWLYPSLYFDYIKAY